MQKNTLFAYFKKVPNPSKSNKEPSPTSKVLKPTKYGNCSDVASQESAASKPKQNGTVAHPVKDGEPSFKVGDIVWSKLEGYPWWPSIVCNHPTRKTHISAGKKSQVHVQFFDDPPSRAWISIKYAKPFTGSESRDYQRGGTFYSADPDCYKGVQEADKALALPLNERLDLVVELQPSSEEDDENNNEEVMDIDDINFDDDIFDAEASDDEVNNSKENHGDDDDYVKGDKDNKKKEKVNISKENHDDEEEDCVKQEKDSKKKDKQTPNKSKTPKRTRAQRGSKSKRRRIIEESGDEDSEDEFKPESGEDSSEDDTSSGVDENEATESGEESEEASPVKASRKRKKTSPAKMDRTPKTARAMESLKSFSTPNQEQTKKEQFTPTVGTKTKSILSGFAAPDMPSRTSPTPENEEGRLFFHKTLDWLRPENIKDGQKRSRDHPDYDPRTLHVPESFLKSCTPAMQQWWNIKALHFDVVLFFKMGKFYELYHMDSDIAVKELGMIYMKGDVAHSGFPEIAYTRYSDTLVQKGYKVARIEQTETPEMNAERCKTMSKPTKFDRVVRREVCQITTKGTRNFSFLDGDSCDAENSYLLAVAEREMESYSVYGVCFIDTSIGKFHIGHFEDDRHGSRFRTLISHYVPAQVLHERGKLSSRTQQIINTNLLSALKEPLTSGTEFWESSKTLKFLSEGEYFLDENTKESDWPPVLKSMISDADSLGHTAADDCDLAVRALGAVTWYLQDCLMEHEMLSMKNFENYQPTDSVETLQMEGKKKSDVAMDQKHMVLDGITLANLDILQNLSTGTLEGTLLERLDQCSTPFGKRLLRQWLCAPLCNPSSINDRLDAIDDLLSVPDKVAESVELLRKLPDLERLLSKIHTLGSANRSKGHPDSRAILYENVTYSKKKIEDFLAVLSGFKTSLKLVEKFGDCSKDFKSKLLRRALTIVPENGDTSLARFPNLKEGLSYFDHAFDHNKARQAGAIIPTKGYVEEYDEAISRIKETERELESYLNKQRQKLGCKSMTYWGTGKNRYQLEVPESFVKHVPNSYDLTSQKKTHRRYHTDEIKEMLQEMTDAEAQRDAALKDTMRRIFHSFDERYSIWSEAVQCLSVFDVLLSLSQYSRCGDGVMCRPEILSPSNSQQPFIEIREARHPCISRTFGGGDFIPNDTVIGIADENEADSDDAGKHAQVVLVTGPNMGGKSTLMRQVGLVVITAQLGCYVPAEKCRLTPVDRVFTRLGASDRIMAGESTFFVELSETSAILQHATCHSLVLLDELGRGTATYDGTAIACAVVQELSTNVRCRTLFSTHYHSLVEEFAHDPNIALGHMACMVENENEEDPSQETITFLYKFIQGACPKSYGFNAARLANIPEEVIKVAKQKAHQFERDVESLKLFRKCFEDNITASQVREIQQICVGQ